MRETEPTDPGAETVIILKIDTYGSVGMQVAFGQVRRKTSPAKFFSERCFTAVLQVRCGIYRCVAWRYIIFDY